MAAEALIVDDAYQRGYADAIADMCKKKRAERQREQAKKARRWYFIKQKAYGLAMLAVSRDTSRRADNRERRTVLQRFD